MQHDFPDLAEDVPEQDLFLSSLPDMFDDYWGELEDMAVGNSEGLTAGSLPSGLGFLGHNDSCQANAFDRDFLMHKAQLPFLQADHHRAPQRFLEQVETALTAPGLLKTCSLSAQVLVRHEFQAQSSPRVLYLLQETNLRLS